MSGKQGKARIEGRRLKVLQLTVAGGSSRAVAAQLERDGYGRISHTTVQKDLRAILAQLATDAKGQAENHRALMNERYNRLFLSWWPSASAVPPDGEASGKVLAILKAMRELNGLDVAVSQRLEHTGAGGIPIAPTVTVNWHDPEPASTPTDVGEAAH